MSFMPSSDVVKVSATTTVSNVAVPTSGPATVNVSNTGTVAVQVGLTQGGVPTGNVVIPAGWPMTVQCQTPEKTPGSVYVWVTSLSSTSDVYITSGFEV